MSTIDVTKLVRDVQESTMQQAFYLQSKAFFEKNNEHINEIARLKAEVERLRASSFVTAVPVEEYEKLKAEVERLTKAGDELHAFLINYIVESRISSAYLNKLDDGWLAAKEGKQP